MYKVFIEDSDPLIASMFMEEGYEISDTHKGVGLICFGGGADVSPSLYNEMNTDSYCVPTRDLYNVFLYNHARLNNIKCVGICRGGQFLNVMNGGSMIQHYVGHNNTIHMIRTSKHNFINVTSDHHQIMIPSKKAMIMALSDTDDKAEVVVYKDSDGREDICFQPHPEWVTKNHQCRDYFFSLLKF